MMGGGGESQLIIKRINLAGHCPFCFERLKHDFSEQEEEENDNDNGVATTFNGSKQLQSVSFLWPYLSLGFDPGDYSCTKVPKFSFVKTNSTSDNEDENGQDHEVTVPQMCGMCLKEVIILKGMHEELVMMRNNVKEQVKRIQGIILAADNSNAEFRREFEEKLHNLVNNDQRCVKDTLKFLAFIRPAVVKLEVMTDLEDHRESSPTDDQNDSPESGSESDEEMRNKEALEDVLCPKAKIEPVSSDEDQFESNQNDLFRSRTLENKFPDSTSADEEENSDNEADLEYILDDNDGEAIAMSSHSGDESESSKASSKSNERKRGRGRPKRKSPGTVSESRSKRKSKYDTRSIQMMEKEKETRKRSMYTCNQCDPDRNPPTFLTEASYFRHRVKAHGAQPLKCKTCSELFYAPRTLYNHERSMHPDTKPDAQKYSCDICNKTFTSRFYIEQHKKIVHFKEKPYFCEYCDLRFTNQVGRESHVRKAHLNERIKCPDCDKSYTLYQSLERHQESAHADKPEVMERIKSRASYKPKKKKKNVRKSTKCVIGTAMRTTVPKDNIKSSENSVVLPQVKEEIIRDTSSSGSWECPPSQTPGNESEEELQPGYVCKLCPGLRPFPSEASLQEHKQQQHQEKNQDKLEEAFPTTCKICSKSFRSVRSLLHHRKAFHRGEELDPIKLPCDKCDKTFAAMFSLQLHQRVVHQNEKLFQCKFCPKTFQNSSGLKFHTQGVHMGERFPCDVCLKTFKYPADVHKHKVKVHKMQVGRKGRKKVAKKSPPKGNIRKESGNTVPTRESSETSTSLTRFEEEKSTPKFTCELCPGLRPFTTETMLLQHKEKHEQHKLQSTEELKTTCQKCSRSFRNLRSLLNHRKNYHRGEELDPIKLPCDKCDKSFSAIFTLQVHQRVVHENEKMFQCKLCPKNFQNSVGLKFHTQSVHLGKRHPCNICLRTFKYPADVHKHKVKVHKLESRRKRKKLTEKYPCTVCQPQEEAPDFLSEDSHRHHMIVYHGADPLECPSCEEKFRWQKTLQNHIKNVHEKGNDSDTDQAKDMKPKEKPTYTCDKCGKFYLCRESLKTHLMKKHDPDWEKNAKAQPHICEICGKKYIHIEGYKMHMKLKHRTNNSNGEVNLCHLCGATFDNPQYLRNHMRNHTLTRKYQCPKCPARFKLKKTCTKHVQEVHNRVKQRNVGIRRMHMAPYNDETEPPEIPTVIAIEESTSKSISNTFPSSSSLNCIPEVKASDMRTEDMPENEGRTHLHL